LECRDRWWYSGGHGEWSFLCLRGVVAITDAADA
jgi:hypothetical protein